MTTDFGHWITDISDIDVGEWAGFIYRVTNLQNNMMYIGRKQFHSYIRKKIVGRINRKKIVNESTWRVYTTSSTTINQLISEFGKELFKFEIIELCKTKAELVYREVEIQWAEKVLSATLPCGSRKYYNGNIGSIKFRLDRHTEKTKEKMSTSATGNKNASGSIRSEVTRKKMGAAKLGVPKSEEHRDKLRNINLHKESSIETKGKIGLAHRGKETSLETKQKMSKSALGRKYTPAISCVVDNVLYDSLAGASSILAITVGVLKRRINSPKYINYQWVVETVDETKMKK